MGILSADIDHRQERDDICAERFGFYDNSGDTGEKITRLRKTIGGFAAGRFRTRVSNLLIKFVIRQKKSAHR